MTAICYGDIVAYSPSRTFRREARSPDNLPAGHPDRASRTSALDEEVSFQRDFCFTLFEGTSVNAVWTLRQPAVSKASPSAAHVSDRGWVVVQTDNHARSELVRLAASPGAGPRISLTFRRIVGAP